MSYMDNPAILLFILSICSDCGGGGGGMDGGGGGNPTGGGAGACAEKDVKPWKE